MAIVVKCPHGHVVKVKDKYAGKKGLCPYCKDRVVISVPFKLTDLDIAEVIGKPPEKKGQDIGSVFDDSEDTGSIWDQEPGETSSVSLVGSSAIGHRRECPNCAQDVPYWYARCPRCGGYFSESTR